MNKIKDIVFGFSIGDALGVPVEFLKREVIKEIKVENMLGYGSHNMPPGTWSDDTSMMLATLDSISEKESLDYNDLMNRFCMWYFSGYYTATGDLFDIGNTTIKSLFNYMKTKDVNKCGCAGNRDNGNGSLMRIIPAVLFCYDNNLNYFEKEKLINNVSSLTHSHEISLLGCNIYADYLINILNGQSKEDAYTNLQKNEYSNFSEETKKLYSNILEKSIKDFAVDNVYSTGYIVYTLEAVFWSILNNNNYYSSVISAIRLGNDTDTIGALTGGLAGVLYGYNTIPKKWIEKLKNKELINNIITKYNINIHNKNMDQIQKRRNKK